MNQTTKYEKLDIWKPFEIKIWKFGENIENKLVNNNIVLSMIEELRIHMFLFDLCGEKR